MLGTGKARARIWIVGGGALVALMYLALSTRSDDAASSAAAAPRLGPDVGVGAGGAQPVAQDGPVETDEAWRQRMNRIDRRARAELGLDDATAQRLDSLQQRLRLLVQEARAQLGAGGATRDEVETRIRQRTGGFRSQIGKVLGSRARSYLRIVEDSRAGRDHSAGRPGRRPDPP